MEMVMRMQLKKVMIAVLALGAVGTVQADDNADVEALMKAMNAEIAQVKETTKAEVTKEVAVSTVSMVKAATTAEDAGSEAVVAAQEVSKVAEAKPNVSDSFDVADRVAERTAEALKANKNEIGNFDHKKKRIVVIGEAEMPIDVKGDKKGDWALKRTMLAKSALLNAKLKMATALGFELTAEEQQQMFNVPATSNSTEKAAIKTSSAIQFASSHPIMGATVLLPSTPLKVLRPRT